MIRIPLLSVPLLVLLAVADPGRALADEPSREPEASNAFVVHLAQTTTAETVISQIVEAGREQLAAACAAHPDASIRVFNPLASGSYADVSCSTILDGSEPVAQSSEALPSGEHIGQIQQKWSPFGLGCTAFVGLSALFVNYALCNRPGAEQPDLCRYTADAGFFGLGIACNFL
jgi:hypothetical protein